MLALSRNYQRILIQQIKNRQNIRTITGYPSTYPVDGRRKLLPKNTVIKFVPQQEAWIIERFGKYNRTLEPGLAILLPVVDQIKYVQSLKEIAIEIPSQSAITLDNVTINLDGVLYLRVEDPYLASYGVEDPVYAVTQLAQTTMRSELGKISLDVVFQERTSLNISIVEAINSASAVWGIKCLRYEIRDIQLPSRVKEAMQMQVEAERKKRAQVLESEGVREAAINVAEGERQSKILASEALKMEQINLATGEAEAIWAKAQARAKALQILSRQLVQQNGEKAASLNIAEQYIAAFSKLAKASNTVILPANTGDAASMVAQAMAVYVNASKNTSNLSNISDEELGEDASDVSNSSAQSSFPLTSLTEADGTHKSRGDDESARIDHYTAAGSPTKDWAKDHLSDKDFEKIL
ncbi:Stomatin-like protein 2, mitochondrial [Trichoplax sp. H2]|nr:Stomatin-like protein 2, mitochondrial [Trichoplax sp. H2]|eukprot:RDD37345.1 Stomatin-like protein 2, mitochondrial [Trichoplax sp. H2]